MESNINISSCKYEEFTGLKLQGSKLGIELTSFKRGYPNLA